MRLPLRHRIRTPFACVLMLAFAGVARGQQAEAPAPEEFTPEPSPVVEAEAEPEPEAPAPEEFTPEEDPLVEAEASAAAEGASAEADAGVSAEVEPDSEPAQSGVMNLGDPMHSFGISLRLGGSFQGRRNYQFANDDYYIYGGNIDRFGYYDDGPGDNGLLLIGALNFGDGHGFATDLNLEVRRYKHNDGTPYGDLAVAPIFGYRIQIIDPLYLSAGAGPRIGFGWSGVEGAKKKGLIGVRLPINATFYFTRMLAAQFELGIGADVLFSSVYSNGTRYSYTETGYTFDMSVGMRFF